MWFEDGMCPCVWGKIVIYFQDELLNNCFIKFILHFVNMSTQTFCKIVCVRININCYAVKFMQVITIIATTVSLSTEKQLYILKIKLIY